MKRPTIQLRNDRRSPILICFSHLRWNFVYQRPQHLMSRAARGYRVLYFEEPLFEGSDAPYLRFREDRSGVGIVEPIFPRGFRSCVPKTLRKLLDEMIERLPERPSLLWYYTPMAMEFSSQITANMCVYDNMDELSAFRGASPKLLEFEQELFDRADAVFTGGYSLFSAKRHRHDNMHPFPSSVDVPHFARSRNLAIEPIDQVTLPHPRIGFFGVIDERMDLALLATIAQRKPEWQLVMIGPVAKIDPATLPQSSNIAWLGMKSYEELPSYLASWDVGIMPFARNESTKFISPTKTPEFLAAGVPVISTRITDVVNPYGKLGLAEIADDADSFIAAGDKLLQLPKREWLQRVDRHLAGNSWDKTWSEMERLLQKEPALTVSHQATGDSALHV